MTKGKHQQLADRFYNRPFKEHDLSSSEINTLLWTIVEFVGTLKDLMTTLEEAAKVIEVDKPSFAHILRLCIQRAQDKLDSA